MTVWKDNNNYTMLCDFYELTMANGYMENGMGESIAYFDMFFRVIPDNGGYALMMGTEQLIEYIKKLKFDEEDISYLRNKGIFSEKFLNYLSEMKFSCDVWAMEEGTPIFPGEPIVIVRGPAIQAQFVETMILLTVNHQSLIATKANRIVRAAQGRAVMEFGSRRAHGYHSAIYGARSAYIAGCVGTACTIADKLFGIPALGTMAHSWIQMFDSEYESFKAYAKSYPQDCTLLVDTYNVLKSGLPNAIKVFNEVVVPAGYRPKGVRIDSGDITYLSKKMRKMLDDAGFEDCKIVVSNSLDEYIIRDTIMQGAKIDSFGVGERLITASSSPVFGGVYKLVAVEKGGNIIPRIKISENTTKVTTPGFKQVYRLFSNETGMAIGDVVTLHNEEIDENEPYVLFDPVETWKKKEVTDYTAKKLLKPIFKNGQCVYDSKPLNEIKNYCMAQIETLWEEVLRFENPHKYYVDLSKSLWHIKNEMLEHYSK
ncbi:MAG: nicotinate phosphoribosyltransferase [Bacillota bacterium]|nr:nicotinate phosphoribosyltransferase [Bacillota bacterium]